MRLARKNGKSARGAGGTGFGGLTLGVSPPRIRGGEESGLFT